jgi:CRP/FNR family transcriptional regulator, cyclic AMP receptor protein
MARSLPVNAGSTLQDCQNMSVRSISTAPETSRSAIEILRVAPCFDEMPLEVVERFSAIARFVSFPKNTFFVRKGEHPPGVAIILSGSICASTVSAEGNEFMISMREFDSVVALTTVLDRKPAFRDSKTQIETEVLLLPRKEFLEVLDESPVSYRYFISGLSERVRAAHRIIYELALCSLRQRLARLLCTLVNPKNRSELPKSAVIPLTQDDLANLLGVTRHATNRGLKRLEQAGLVHARYGTIVVNDLPALAAMAESAEA